jgi:putative Holliday junction resolvase
MGIDLGSKRIGVAVSDAGGVLASPYEVVPRSGDEQRDHRRLLAIAAEVEAERIVVGLPLSLDGSMGPAATAAVAEAERLGATTDLPVDLYDERFTTVTADRHLMERKLKADARRRIIDKVAAAVMLQAWLDGRPRPVPPEQPDPEPPDPS